MPEGDTVEKVRRALSPMLVTRTIVDAQCRWPDVVRGIRTTTCTNIEAFGKHLLVWFSDDTCIRVHLGMTGEWHRYDPGERWRRPHADLGVSLSTNDDVVVCFRCPEVERLTKKERDHQVALASLGPDVLKDPFDIDEVMRRARHPDRAAMAVSEVLLDQRVCAGIGNIFKCESLFANHVAPTREVARVDDDTLRALYATASRMTRESVAHERLQRIYSAKVCPTCNGRVRVEEVGERVTWWCPRCQP